MITKRIVDAAKPGDVLWDDELKGFSVRCRDSGRCYYQVKYRYRGRVRWFTIGAHGVWTPALARNEAKRILGEVAAGRDPAAARDTSRAAPTIADLVERFLVEHVRTKNKERTRLEYEREIKKFILPAIGRHRVDDVTRSDIAHIHHDLRETPYQANRVLAICSKLFSWAQLIGLRAEGSNPARGIQRYREQKRQRFLSEAEIARLGTALHELENADEVSPWIAAAIRLLILTGARRGEVLGLRWEEVDIESGLLRLPDSKTGAKTIYLNAPARQILAELPRIAGNPFVIVGQRNGAHLVNLNDIWDVVRKRADLDDLRIHDLRHSFASVGAAGGLSLPIIGALLGHTQAATTQRYAHLSADPLRAANEQIGKTISKALAVNETKAS